MGRIEITSITGSTPISVYVSDAFGNYETLIGVIGTSVPPAQYLYPPSIFNTAPAVLLKLVFANGCEVIKLLECREGCWFDLIIETADCKFNISIEPAPDCLFSLSVETI
jgi:hypothetical protein